MKTLERARFIWLIPAWAGKTPTRFRVVRSLWAHPRVGGENRMGRRPSRRIVGSSPRGRGKRADVLFRLHELGLIPAWAGKTSNFLLGLHQDPAHPRVGGENVERCDARVIRAGSSPRGRGKHSSDKLRNRWVRLIPAWAGKTAHSHPCSYAAWAHPRVGGENGFGGDEHFGDHGSSPRGRGKQISVSAGWEKIGLIPAWAGKTSTPMNTWRSGRAHPRVGGENGPSPGMVPRVVGSSPRGRGKLGIRVFRVPFWRLIPAWAGKTQYWTTRGAIARAHPRVGGENCDPCGN